MVGFICREFTLAVNSVHLSICHDFTLPSPCDVMWNLILCSCTSLTLQFEDMLRWYWRVHTGTSNNTILPDLIKFNWSLLTFDDFVIFCSSQVFCPFGKSPWWSCQLFCSSVCCCGWLSHWLCCLVQRTVLGHCVSLASRLALDSSVMTFYKSSTSSSTSATCNCLVFHRIHSSHHPRSTVMVDRLEWQCL